MLAALPTPGSDELVATLPSVTPEVLSSLLTEALKAVLVSFQAPGWEALIPSSRDVENIFGARLRIVHVDLANYPELAVQYKIRVIPTLLLFTHGVLTAFIVGLIPSRFLVKTLSTALGVRVSLNIAERCRLGRNLRRERG